MSPGSSAAVIASSAAISANTIARHKSVDGCGEMPPLFVGIFGAFLIAAIMFIVVITYKIARS